MTETTEIFKHDTLSGLPWVILEIMERAFLGLSWRALSLVFVQMAWRKLISWHWRWGQLRGGVVISFRGVGVVGVWGSAGEFGKLRGRKNPLPWRTSVPVPLLCEWFNYDDGDKNNALGWWFWPAWPQKAECSHIHVWIARTVQDISPTGGQWRGGRLTCLPPISVTNRLSPFS